MYVSLENNEAMVSEWKLSWTPLPALWLQANRTRRYEDQVETSPAHKANQVEQKQKTAQSQGGIIIMCIKS